MSKEEKKDHLPKDPANFYKLYMVAVLSELSEKYPNDGDLGKAVRTIAEKGSK